jgi:hypothetical protein
MDVEWNDHGPIICPEGLGKTTKYVAIADLLAEIRARDTEI